MKEVIKAFNNQKIVKVGGHNYLVNPITDHSPDATYALLSDVVKELSGLTSFYKANKIVGEEDRGGFVAALIAYAQKKSLGMVKWNPPHLKAKIGVDFRNAYTEGKMYLLGCKKGDNVVLVEDLIDTGGTIISMVKLLRKHKINILDIICLADKEEYAGIDRIENETGIRPKSLVQFTCLGKRSKVVKVKGKPVKL
jgi:adenine/guanine phosphoribosyltransferase-like PRPP-binding protein